MNAERLLACKLKAKIKRLYKEYDQHLDRIVKLDETLTKENNRISQCLQSIGEYSQLLTECDKQAVN